MASRRAKPGLSRTSATVLSVVSIALFSVVRNLSLLSDIRYHEEHLDHFPLVTRAAQRSSPLNKNDDSFSACLLTMDDGHFLVEWLAYHYHVLPLRRLIVAVDPKSKTSLSLLWNRWRQQGMVIDEWSDAQFLPSNARQQAKKTLQHISNMTDETRLHHFRQRVFYAKCLQQLQSENRTWTMFLDSDEYLLLNPRKQQEQSSTMMPSMKEPGSIVSLLKQQHTANKTNASSPCIMIPRLRFGTVKSSHDETYQGVPSPLNASKFTTLRFRKHAALNDFDTNKLGKGILDVSRVNTTSQYQIRDPHRLVWEYCPESGLRSPNENSDFVIHHYLGTSEQFQFRDDVRTNRKSFEQFKNVNAGTDDAIRPWIQGFVEKMGVDTATQLLEGVGDVKRWPSVNDTSIGATGKKQGSLNLLSSLSSAKTNKLADEDTFSACLLVMDDNHVLVEFLAYHYHVLPLRHLIVAVDPRSKTSPSRILNRWRKHGMTIQEWSDKDFLSEKLLTIAQNISSLNDTAVVDLHLARQNEFYEKCMVSLKEQNRRWTELTDTDEFLMINKRAIDRFNVSDAPPIEQPGSIMTFLKQELAKDETEMPKEAPCIMIPRLRFGSKESDAQQVDLQVPAGFNASAFTTLRYRKHAEPKLSKLNKGGKVIIDVSRIHPANMHVNNPHRPLFVYCPKSEMYTQIKDNLFVVHHYSGSLEQFTFRDDLRDTKAKEAFEQYSDLDLDDDSIRPWLGGFVEEKGVDAATELLRGVGDVRYDEEVEETRNATVADEDTFSACLLVMDDNHVLLEWLAYHYHVMPLRHLIVAVDPRSKTSPSEILDRWRDHGMTIEEWSDKDFMDDKLLFVANHMAELNRTQIIDLHRARQRIFYEKCMKRFKKQNRKWTMLTDTDEFLLINKRATDRFNVTDAPPMEQPGSVMSFIKQERAKPETEMPKKAACIMIPRLRFGSKESTLEQINQRVPAGFNASAFTTLRHRKHAEPKLSVINKTGKVIVDVSRLHPGRMKVKNPHRPLWAYCPRSELYTLIKDNLLVIHHYAGTWEQYTYREDFRAMKTKEEFDRYNARNLDDDAIRPWLDGFVQDQGAEKASALLKDVGELPPINTSVTAI